MPATTVDLAVRRAPVREHILDALRETNDFRIRYVMGSAHQAVAAVRASPPGVLLLSTGLSDAPWQQAVAHLRDVNPSVPVVAVSHCDDAEHVAELLTHGFAGCLIEDESADAILGVLDAVGAGDVRFSRCVLWELTQSHPPGAAPVALSERQWEILNLLANGHNNERIAEALLLSEGTVRNYVSDLYKLIGVESRVEAALWVWRYGPTQ